jgi:16S rRNA C967 or C1407 C5-methylase (RsmB/RsmF family)
MKNALAVAIEALSWMAYEGLGERAALFRASDQLGASVDELRQAHRIVMETIRFQNRIEHLISILLSANSSEDIPHGVSSFLKILVYLRHVDHAKVSEIEGIISLGRHILGWEELKPYEKIIGRILFGLSNLKPQDEDERVALVTCHSSWYVGRVLSVFGRDFGLRILERDLTPIPFYLRANPLRASPSNVERILKDMEAVGVPGVWRAVNLKNEHRKAMALGEVVVQDLSGIVAGLVASPRPGETVLDVCAAPGNKTSHVAAEMANRGVIFSVDISPKRMIQWRLEMAKAGVMIAYPIISDAAKLDLNLKADLVIVDPPCSNAGVFAKNPSMKWRISSSRLCSLRVKQLAILNSASKCVRSGGSLIYCTCSILPEENEGILEDFLHRNPDFYVERQRPFLGLPGLRGFERCQRFYPHLHNCSGFFIARLGKD